MDKVLSGRLWFVLIVTIISIVFIYPTTNYFFYVSGLPEEPNEQQIQKKEEMLDEGDMITLGLDLQGGSDLLVEVQTEELLRNKLIETGEDIRSEFVYENIDVTIKPAEDEDVLLINVNNYEDENIARLILEDFEGINQIEVENIEDIAGGGTVRIRRPAQMETADKTEAVDTALRIIRGRLDEFGLTQPVVIKQPPNRIRVQIPGQTDPERIKANILRPAVLQFRLVHPQLQTEIADFVKPGSIGSVEGVGTGIIRDEFIEEVPSELKEGETKLVLRDNIPGVPATYELVLGTHRYTDEAGNLQNVENLAYLVKDTPFITGAMLLNASPFTNPTELNPDQRHKVTMTFNGEGTENLADISSANEDKQFAIMLDNKVFSAPVFRSAILYGQAEISGNFTQQESIDLALTLRSGSLQAPLSVISEQVIGASLGQESVVASGKAILWGAIFLVITLMVIYRAAGVIAVLAMILNILLILAVLSAADATLTLSGIGGILLTMGMAVDANVLIYERLREELDSGKPLRAALSAAFDRAFTVILDSNITSLLPALVLILFEIVEGSVKGFWTALAIGLIANLYTAMTVTRALVDSYVSKKGSISVGKIAPFKNAKFDFMAYRKIGYPLSAIVLIGAGGYLLVNGVNPGIDFTGGVTATVSADPSVISQNDLKAALEDDFQDLKVVSVLNQDYYQVTLPATEGVDDSELQDRVTAILEAEFGDQASISALESVDSVVGSEFKVTAFFTVFVASIIILGYIAMRFKLAFGLGAVAALIHDLIIALGIFILLGNSLTLDIVSALLIILGYSVNDTIVVFDRIRENMKEYYSKSISEVINASINQTLTRTIFTSGTTLITILSMLVLGGIALKDFALILLIGIIAGTYSSIFVASAVVNSILTREEAREGIAASRGQRKKVKISA